MIGVAPVVVIGPVARRAVAAVDFPLGTVGVVAEGDGSLSVQPVAVETISGGGDEPTRLIGVDVEVASYTGAVTPSAVGIVITDADGNRYAALDDPRTPGKAPPFVGGPLRDGESRTGGLAFEVPSRASALAIELVSADGATLATWSLASH